MFLHDVAMGLFYLYLGCLGLLVLAIFLGFLTWWLK